MTHQAEKMKSLIELNNLLAKLDREQNDNRDNRNKEKIVMLLPLIKEAEKRENRLCEYLQWLYLE